MAKFEVRAIGRVESALTDAASAPRQADEGAPEAVLVFDDDVAGALEGLRAGDEVVVLTWLHLAKRDVLRVRPRDDASREVVGVFATRSQDRPNPVGLHRVEVLACDGSNVQVKHLEAVDGTPIIDLKPVLAGDVGER